MFRCVLAASLVLAFPVAALAAAPAPATGAMAVTGLWVTPNDESNNQSRVKIYRGDNGKFFGKVVWLKQPRYPSDFDNKALAGKPKVDRHNPNEALRNRPVMGLNVLTGFRYLPGDNAWGKGKCYDPVKGKTYVCRMWLIDGGKRLKVRGYVWIFHRTETWTRYVPPAPKPAAQPASAVSSAAAAPAPGTSH